MPPPPRLSRLSHLALDLSEDTAGTLTLEAMAAGHPQRPQHWGDIEAQLTTVLDWASQLLGAAHGPLDEGHVWDHDLQRHEEGDGWCTVTLTLSVAPAAAQAFLDAFVHHFGDPREAEG